MCAPEKLLINCPCCDAEIEVEEDYKSGAATGGELVECANCGQLVAAYNLWMNKHGGVCYELCC